MSEQSRVDPDGLRIVGRVFGETARSVDVAVTGLSGCTFGDHMGVRYGRHAANYAAGMLAVSQSMGRLGRSSLRFGDSLKRSADELAGADSSNAEAFRVADHGNPDG